MASHKLAPHSLIRSSFFKMNNSFPLPLDVIALRDFTTAAVVGPDAWGRPSKPQPLILSLSLGLDTRNAAASDGIDDTFSYGLMCKEALADIEDTVFSSISDLITSLGILAARWPGQYLQVQALLPKALLRCDGGLELIVVFTRKSGEAAPRGGKWSVASGTWSTKRLILACIIGVNPHEREQKQTVVIGLKVVLEVPTIKEDVEQEVESGHTYEKNEQSAWQDIVRAVCDVVEPTSFQTLEALAALIAKTCLTTAPIPNITVIVEKPSAIAAVEGAGVQITRDRAWLEQQIQRQ